MLPKIGQVNHICEFLLLHLEDLCCRYLYHGCFKLDKTNLTFGNV